MSSTLQVLKICSLTNHPQETLKCTGEADVVGNECLYRRRSEYWHVKQEKLLISLLDRYKVLLVNLLKMLASIQ